MEHECSSQYMVITSVYFTKWVETIGISDKLASTVFTSLFKVIVILNDIIVFVPTLIFIYW